MPLSTWERGALAVLVVGAFVGFLLVPTYPTYDSFYALLWGRELLHFHIPHFQVYRTPTEHPLAIAFGVLLSIFGSVGARLMILGAILSFVALVAGIYRLGQLCFGTVVGVVAALLMLTRFDFEYLAAQGYLDITYMALIMWAAALEVAKPRRGPLVFILLAGAGLLRPESWLLIGAYWLWCAWPADNETRLRYLALALIAPVVWAGLDTIATGDPLYSFHSTSQVAEELGRTQGITNIPSATLQFLDRLDKVPVVLAAVAGLIAAIVITPRRVIVPLVALLSGLLTFFMLGAAGLSVIDRYLLTPSAFVLFFAAVAVGGWSMLEPGSWLRRAWMLGAAAVVIYGAASAARTLSVTSLRVELAYRNDFHVGLEKALANPMVKADMACGPLSLPNNKLTPDAQWILGDESQNNIIARSQARSDALAGDDSLDQRLTRGVQIYPLGPAVFYEAIVDVTDDPRDQVPPPGWRRIYTSQYYAAYARCG
ncbi:MAG TPA: hypothetical protein VHX88_12320 [Solirubrobacteraceae bacterium]|nr:hypothetical protein [Solirubrobacteraceae bacterium]